jgi:hypothetical protein
MNDLLICYKNTNVFIQNNAEKCKAMSPFQKQIYVQ